jgi:hypothetical protein
MDVAAMARRCPGAKLLGLARLPRHRFVITRDGYASVLRDPRAATHGALWDLSLADVRVLDKFEEVDRGLYVKIVQPVIAEAGPRRALIYVGSAGEIGAPRPGYLESVIASAEALGLPAAYRQEMARYLTGRRHVAAVPAEGPVAGVRVRAAAPSNRPAAAPAGAARASDAWSWKP